MTAAAWTSSVFASCSRFWWQEFGPRDHGTHVLPEWYGSEEEALAAAVARWRPVRGGLRYPLQRAPISPRGRGAGGRYFPSPVEACARCRR